MSDDGFLCLGAYNFLRLQKVYGKQIHPEPHFCAMLWHIALGVNVIVEVKGILRYTPIGGVIHETIVFISSTGFFAHIMQQ